MSRTLIGISTFGNLPFTRLAVQSIRETAKKDVSVLIVVGKPDDLETREFADKHADLVIHHDRNYGFPASCNDVFDEAWKHADFDFCILMGNDVIAYPGCIDGMIEMAESGQWEQVCGTIFDVHSLLHHHPETVEFFHGPNFVFRDFDARPWDLHQPRTEYGEEPNSLKDIQNMTLYTKGAFTKLGYFDVGFWPNGYFSDNSYAMRGLNAGVKGVGASHCEFFHFWSRTIHQGDSRPNNVYFDRNRELYIAMWGGEPGKETKAAPNHIGSRTHEKSIIDHFSKLT
jgi:GT2 family glycosyltransferase